MVELGSNISSSAALKAVDKFTGTIIVAKSEPAHFVTTDYASDNACIQAAIDYVSGLGGGSVVIREGTYTYTGVVTISSNISIFGAGPSTILQTSNAINLLSISSESNIHLHDLKLECNGTGLKGLFIENSSNILIENVIINDVTQHTIWIDSSHDIVVSHSTLTNSADELISIPSSFNITISDCYLNTAAAGCILLYNNCYNIKINNNYIGNGSVAGIRIQAATNVEIINNTIRKNLKGVSITLSATNLWWTENIIIQGNNILNNVEHGVSTTPAGLNQVRNLSIIGNQIYRSGKEGIYLTGNYHLINNNVISDNGQTTIDTYQGILLTGCKYVVCTNNVIANRDQEHSSLLTVDPSLPTAIITVANGTFFEANQWVTISDDTPFTENNQIDSVSGNNITLKTNLANAYTQVQNAKITVRATQKRGIRITGSSDRTIISNNMLQNNTSVPLLEDAGFNHTIINNMGYNPVGAVGPPAVPATTVNYSNVYGYPCNVLISGGTVTEIDIHDIATGLTSGMFTIPPNGTINITYSVAPSWLWWGL